tara:strand:- start:56 stop:364 length:309 start_codon:yes stop_codon:yes gene_type:complete
MRKIAILSLLVFLNACGMTAPGFLATGTGAYSEYKVTSLIKTGTDLALSAADLPTTNDMVLSRITGYECKVSRALKEGIEYICKDVKIHPPTNTTIDNDEKK